MKRLDANDVKLVKFINDNWYSMTNREMVEALKGKYCSKSGVDLTESHMSNFCRKDLGLRRMPTHQKLRYKGRNWVICKKLKEGKMVLNDLKTNKPEYLSDPYIPMLNTMMEKEELLNDWELGFVVHQIDNYRNKKSLTKKQKDTIVKIYNEKIRKAS